MGEDWTEIKRSLYKPRALRLTPW